MLDGVYIFGDFCTGIIRGMLKQDKSDKWYVVELLHQLEFYLTSFPKYLRAGLTLEVSKNKRVRLTYVRYCKY